MNSSLLLRFAGPQQSWGSSEMADRNSEPVPTRSAVIGLLAASLGAPRNQWPDWLYATTMWARVDRKGELSTDFHTVGVPSDEVVEIRSRHRKITGNSGRADFIIPLGSGAGWRLGGGTMVTNRQYLADAEFFIALQHPDESRTEQLATATRRPVFMTYLGRKAFAPAFPFHLGLRAGAPQQVLESFPTQTVGERGLPLHHLAGDQNYAERTVHPPVIGSISGWVA